MEISVDVVRRLVTDQFPRWSDLPVEPVRRQGHDNRTFRLGDELTVRLPSAQGYVPGVAKEDRWLPVLAGHLMVAVPAPVATGRPSREYPYPWSVRRWLDGCSPEEDPALDRTALARGVGAFLTELHGAPTDGAPLAGRHSAYRGCHPSVYGDEVQSVLDGLGDRVDRPACEAIWSDAVTSAWSDAPVWVHGDVAVDNLVTRDGELAAVIDFGQCGAGDPACDLVLAWTFFDVRERAAFREAVSLPDDAWARARGWALWKALITLAAPRQEPASAWTRALPALMDDVRGGMLS